MTLVPMRPFYRIRFDDGTSFAMCGEAEAMRAEVERLSPGEAHA